MDGRRVRMAWGAVMCAGALAAAVEAKAQTAASSIISGSFG